MANHFSEIILPPAGTLTWGSRTKAAVVLAIRKGLITREQAYADYLLSPEELEEWEAAHERGGYRALSIKAAHSRKRGNFNQD